MTVSETATSKTTLSEANRLSPAKPIAERSLIWLGAITTGVVVTNLFAPQILVGMMGRSLTMSAGQAGMISTLISAMHSDCSCWFRSSTCSRTDA